MLEVKCLYTVRKYTISDACKNKTCLHNENGVYTLKNDNVYLIQIQGQIFLTKRSYHFVVWTTKETAILKMAREESWKLKLDVMEDSYVHHIFPKAVERGL